MGIWDTEVIRVDGHLFAYIRVQNYYSGNVSGSFRRIYQDNTDIIMLKLMVVTRIWILLSLDYYPMSKD